MVGSSAPSPAKALFRRDIEGVRGIAILLVLAYHIGLPLISGGYIGVDVFFVLSGYLITWMLVHELTTTGRIQIGAFYARRIRRLLPALVVVLATTMLVGSWVYSPLEQATFATTALTTVLYASNLVFITQNTDYLGPSSAANPLLHTWSLGVEEQFYLVWPLLLVIVLRWRFASETGRQRFLMAFFALMASVSFGYCLIETARFQPVAFFSPLARAWEFALGGLIFTMPRLRRAVIARAAGWLGLAMVVGTAVLFTDHTTFPGPWALIPVLGTLGMLYAGAHGAAGSIRWLDGRWLQLLGRYSYGIYLWHWPVLKIASTLIPGIGLGGRLACLVLTGGLAVGSYRLVENPIRHARRLASRPVLTLLLGFSITGGTVMGLIAWRQVIDHTTMLPAQAIFARAAQQGDAQRDVCMASHRETQVAPCVLGNPQASTTVAVFGDSHVLQWLPALDAAASAQNWRVVTFIKAACSPADIQNTDWLLGRRFYECEQWRAAAIAMLTDLQPDLIVMSAKQWYLTGTGGTLPVDPGEWRAGMQQTLSRLTAHGTPIVYVRDTPIPGFNIPECLSREAWQPRLYGAQTCSFAQATALDPTVYAREREVLAAYPSVELVDLTPAICPQTPCMATVDGLVVYRDDNHLTTAFAAHLAPIWEGLIAAALEGRPVAQHQSLRPIK